MANSTLLIGLGVAFIAIIAIFFRLRLLKGKRQKIAVELVEKNQLTHDTIVFTFTLPSSSSKLGLKVGQHIEIEQNIKGEIVKRKYTPISPIDRVGSFQLLMKIYRPIEQFPNGGKMSIFLADAPLNSKINITYPYGRFNYLGNGNTQITDFDNNVTKRKYKNFYMVAGGTGITPIFQVIQYCCENEKKEDRPGLYLLFANRTEDDILMKQTLDGYAAKHNVNIFYSVDKSVTTNWTGFTGYVSENKITDSMPKQVKETLFMSCGPPPLCNGTEKIWRNLGVPTNQIFRF